MVCLVTGLLLLYSNLGTPAPLLEGRPLLRLDLILEHTNRLQRLQALDYCLLWPVEEDAVGLGWQCFLLFQPSLLLDIGLHQVEGIVIFVIVFFWLYLDRTSPCIEDWLLSSC